MDEHGQALDESPDPVRLVDAYLANYLDCGRYCAVEGVVSGEDLVDGDD